MNKREEIKILKEKADPWICPWGNQVEKRRKLQEEGYKYIDRIQFHEIWVKE